MAWKNTPQQRSYACNPEMLAFLREQKGWTQKQLAKRSGYSERLISKSEAGQPISTAAISVLAETLSSTNNQVFPEDLITDPIKYAKEYLAAVYTKGKGLVDAIEHFLDENVVFRITGDPAHIPFAGEHRGIDGLRRMFDIFFSILEAPDNHDHTACYHFVGKGNEVTMWGESWIHPIGQPLQKPISISNRFVFQQGKLILLEDIFDTHAGSEAIKVAEHLHKKGR